MFEPIDSNNLKPQKMVNTNRVIKNTNVAVNGKFVVESKKFIKPKPVEKISNNSVNKIDNTKKIEPIVEGDRIIGIKYHCDCGKCEDIFFEYESE